MEFRARFSIAVSSSFQPPSVNMLSLPAERFLLPEIRREVAVVDLLEVEVFKTQRQGMKMGLRASQTSEMIFKDCRIPKENLLGQAGQGIPIAMTTFDHGRMGIAAQSIGILQAALDESVKYSADSERNGAVRVLPAPPPSAVQVIERKPKPQQAGSITEARVVIGVGRGFEKAQDLNLARELADVLGGEIGCTRPLSAELHWLSEELCIGLSGLQIKPELYMGLGVSGQIQHTTGIRNAKWICAVNSDENAPIFGVADFGIVGDLYDVIPKLLAELKK